MKRFIKLNSDNEIIDLFHEHASARMDGTEIFLDEVEEQTVYINGKCILDEIGNPIFKFKNGIISEIDLFKYINQYKQIKKQEIKSEFEKEISDGKMTSISLGIDVDYRRSVTKNDMQNVEALISHMESNNIPQVIYSGYESQTTTATIEKLKNLLKEMQAYGITLYNKKHELLNNIDSVKTLEGLNKIQW